MHERQDGLLTVQHDQNRDGYRLRLIGELDLSNAGTFAEELERAQSAGSEEILLDIERLKFIDSTGLGVLVRATQWSEVNGRRLRVTKTTAEVTRLLDLTGVKDRLSFTD
jgi:anti-sigma B factor antagonist